MAQYQIVGTAFWRGETILNAANQSSAERNRVLGAPILESTSAGLEYSRAAVAADSFLKIADEHNISNWMSNPVVYFGALSHYTLGDYKRAAELFTRVSPDYKRDYYNNDRILPDPEYSVPIRPSVSKLLFYSRLKSLPENPADAFAALHSITHEALSTLQAQKDYAHFLANRPIVHDRRDWSENTFGDQPDQKRAGALPSTLQLVEEAWDKLLESSLGRRAKPVRDFLRSLNTPDAPFARLASYKLQRIDALIIKDYFAEAQNLMNRKNFDGARVKYRQIIAEYSGSEAAMRAEAELPEIVLTAVTFYKAEGDKNWQPDEKPGVPQAQAREFYQKMYEEDPNGPQADYALYKWSQALGSETKTAQAVPLLHQWIDKFPYSPLRAEAMYLLGFFYGSQTIRKRDEAIKWMERVVKEHPDSEEAPESLWHIAFYYSWTNGQFEKGIPYLEQLQQQYPQSPRWKHTAKWMQIFKERSKGN